MSWSWSNQPVLWDFYIMFLLVTSLDVRYCFLSKAWRDSRRLTWHDHPDLSSYDLCGKSPRISWVCCFWSWNALQHYLVDDFVKFTENSITSHNSLCMSVWNQRGYNTELGSHSGLSYSFLAALSKVFRTASCIKPYEGTILTSGKVCSVQYLLVFRLISGYTCERLIPGLRRKQWILRALLLAVTSLWRQKVGSRQDWNLLGKMEIHADILTRPKT